MQAGQSEQTMATASGDLRVTLLDSSTVIETPNGIVRFWPDGLGGAIVTVAKAQGAPRG